MRLFQVLPVLHLFTVTFPHPSCKELLQNYSGVFYFAGCVAEVVNAPIFINVSVFLLLKGHGSTIFHPSGFSLSLVELPAAVREVCGSMFDF